MPLQRERAQKARAKLGPSSLPLDRRRAGSFVPVVCGGVNFAARRNVTPSANSSARLLSGGCSLLRRTVVAAGWLDRLDHQRFLSVALWFVCLSSHARALAGLSGGCVSCQAVAVCPALAVCLRGEQGQEGATGLLDVAGKVAGK